MNGLLIQWGIEESAGTHQFPASFKYRPICVSHILSRNDSHPDYEEYIDPISELEYKLDVKYGGGAEWLAIGQSA